MADQSKINRRFERMFPQISDDEQRYNSTLYAEGKTAAKRELQIINSERQREIGNIMKETASTEESN